MQQQQKQLELTNSIFTYIIWESYCRFCFRLAALLF